MRWKICTFEQLTQIELYQKILAEGLSVRRVEALVKAFKNPSTSKEKADKPEELTRLESQLAAFFNTKVVVTQSNKGKGKIHIDFASDRELATIISKLND